VPLLTLPENLRWSPVFSEVRVAPSLVFYLMFCRSLFVLLPFFFWPLYCLSFFDLLLLITPLVSSNFFFLQKKPTTFQLLYNTIPNSLNIDFMIHRSVYNFLFNTDMFLTFKNSLTQVFSWRFAYLQTIGLIWLEMTPWVDIVHSRWWHSGWSERYDVIMYNL
jgi:hypothetical protein